MRSRSALLILGGALLVAWLLLSSIHFIQPTQASQQSGPQQNSGGGGGASSSITKPLFQLPNVTVPSIKFPGFNFTLPHIFSVPGGQNSVNVSGSGSGLGGSGSGGGLGSGDGSGDGSGSGSGAGSGGNGGSGGSSSGQSPNSGGSSPQTTTTSTKQNPLTLPYQLLLIVIILIVVLAGTAIFVSRRGRLGLSRKPKQPPLGQETLQLAPPLAAEAAAVSPVLTELSPQEIVVPFRGWGQEEAGFIKPQIKPELPLIWSLSDPLMIEAPEGATVSLRAGSGGSILRQDSTTMYLAEFAETCNVLEGSYQGQSERKYVRAVRYSEDVIKHFRLNFFRISDEELRTLTPRELAGVLVSKYSESISDQGQLFRLIRVFERVFYGKKEISRADYEEFLVSLSTCLSDPKVIICGTSNKQKQQQATAHAAPASSSSN